jgi:hypothetical protein
VAGRKAAARGKISIDGAFRKLRPALGPNGAVDEMNKAMLRDDKRARLFCNGRVVNPNFIRNHLVVSGPGSRRADGRRRRNAEIVATRALDEPVASYTWRMDAKEVEALRPMTSDKPARKGARERRQSRAQGLIRRVAGEIWPGGYEQVETREIIKRASDELERRGLPVPKRDVFLRALDRR